jgi:hypothetical protein
VFKRGRNYFRDGLVRDTRYTAKEITAVVRGAYDYDTRLLWENGRLQFRCSCPYGAHCKHCAALLLRAREELRAKRSEAVALALQPELPPAPPPPPAPLLGLLLPVSPATARCRLTFVCRPQPRFDYFDIFLLVDTPKLRQSVRGIYEMQSQVLNSGYRDLPGRPEWGSEDRQLFRTLLQIPSASVGAYHAYTVDDAGLSTLLLAAVDHPRFLLAPAAGRPVRDPYGLSKWDSPRVSGYQNDTVDLTTLQPLAISLAPLRLELDGAWTSSGAHLRPRFWRPDGTEVEAARLHQIGGHWWFDGRSFFRADNSFQPSLVAEAAHGHEFDVDVQSSLQLLEPVRAQLSPALAAAWPVIETVAAQPVFYLDQEDDGERLLMRVLFRWQEGEAPALEWPCGDQDADCLPYSTAEGPSRWLRCDPEPRREMHHRLIDGAFQDAGGGEYRMEGFQRCAEFLFTRLEEWKTSGEFFITDAVRRLLEGGREVNSSVAIQPSGSGLDWFELDVKFFDLDEPLDTTAIWAAIRSGRNYVRLRDKQGESRVLTMPKDGFRRLRRELDELEDATGQANRCSPFLLFSAVEGLRQSGAVSLSTEANAFYDKLKSFRGIRTAAPPPELDSVLRHYQKEGLAYLHYLEELNFGGVLADDMGLGKTLQVLAFLENLRRERGTMPSLVVCPTSVGHNWIAEAARFTPALKTVLMESGVGRHRHFESLEQYDLVVTSYALLRRDMDKLGAVHFRVMILDEAQNIKNPGTKGAACARQIVADRRLALTGTPLENSVLDLWSIYDVVLPGLLGSQRKFQQRFQNPIEKENIPEARQRLARRLRPFLLRRLKSEVVPELPPRIEQVMECDLTVSQRRLYREVAEQARGEVMQTVKEKGLAKSQIHILAALMRLRQICCHPMLLGAGLAKRMPDIAPEQFSGKFNAFVELLDTLLEGEHRVLIFSSFVKMLRIIRDHLDKRKVPYAYLDGATLKRKEAIEEFQSGTSQRVFLLSLKAGGTGVNLTAADYVILYDPWWNPAVENQAIDRTHRIGQTKTVMAYRMVTRGTVEEKIMELQRRKSALVQAVVENDTAFAKHLTVEDLEELFRVE